jgi:putative colanic acid biosynthesis acetyltransferase WcaF
LYTHQQSHRGSSPWSLKYRSKLLLWEYVWSLLCKWTPKPFNPWRLFVLRAFGCSITGTPFVHQRARIDHPWNLTLHHLASIGDRTHLYCLDEIVIQSGAIVAQEVYICTGTHDFSNSIRALQTAPVSIGSDSFIGARSFILPGLSVGKGAIVGACSVVTRSVESYISVAGNPAKVILR